MSADKGTDALRVAVLKVLFDRWALLDREARDRLLEATVPGERLPAVLPGSSEPVAWVTRTKPTKAKPAATVTDASAFLAWCYQHRPDEVVVPPAPAPHVRSSYVAAVLAAVDEVGGVMLDPSTGELTVPEGVEVVTPTPAKSNLRVTLEDGAAAALEAAWRDGSLHLDPLGELPGGDA